LIPILILILYQWYTRTFYGQDLLYNAVTHVKFTTHKGLKWITKSVTGLIFTGGCFAVLFYIPYLSKRLLISCFAIFLLSSAFIYNSCLFGIYLEYGSAVRLTFSIQAGVMLAIGGCIFWLMFADLLKNRNAESVLLFLWISGTFIFASFINWSINARSVLPLIPAACILLFRQMGKIKKTWLLIWPLVPSAIITLLVCASDYTLADSARLAANELCKTYQKENKKIWFQGHWGFQYYMELFNAKALNLKKEYPDIGDLVVSAVNNTNIIDLPTTAVQLYNTFQFRKGEFLTTMDNTLGAGFYSDLYGNLPFVAGPVSSEPYLVHIVIR